MLPGLGPIEPELDALLGGEIGEPLLARTRLLRVHPVLAGDVVGEAALPVPRRARVELEGPPHHFDVVGVRELGERGLEAPLADVAPRADDVRPDLDSHHRLHSRAGTPYNPTRALVHSGAHTPAHRGMTAGSLTAAPVATNWLVT